MPEVTSKRKKTMTTTKRRLSTKNARAIRVGINARCLPYITGGDDKRGYYTVLDFARVREHELDWQLFGETNLLSCRAYERTAPWTSVREESNR